MKGKIKTETSSSFNQKQKFNNRIQLLILCSTLLSFYNLAIAQNSNPIKYEVSTVNPYGKLNPDAPKQISDYASLIGVYDCKSTKVRPDGSWEAPTSLTWKFSYIMNGTAVQDQSLDENGTYSGSIRQYSLNDGKWYIHYYSSEKITTVSNYHGNKIGNEIVLYKSKSDITMKDGKKLFFRLTFSNISEKGFNWVGAWVDNSIKPDKVLGQIWKISCKKR